MDNYKNHSDSDILDGIKTKSSDAFKAIYHDRTKQLKNYVINNNGTAEDAQDIEQKAMIVLYEKVISGGFVLTSKLSTYLYSVGKNLWLKELNHSKRTTSLSIEVGNDLEDINFRMIAANEDEEQLLRCFVQLGEVCQTILRGKYYDKISDKNLSETLVDISEMNVRKRRYKCLQKLKKMFMKQKNL